MDTTCQPDTTDCGPRAIDPLRILVQAQKWGGHLACRQALRGDPTKSLMHGDAQTTRKSYIDRRQLPAEGRRLFVPWSIQAGEDAKATEWL
jgi:hypothetical protein